MPEGTHHYIKRVLDEVLVALSLDSRAEVDRMVETALAAGAGRYKEPQDHGFMYGWGFEDLDGHIWEYFWMDPAAAAGAYAGLDGVAGIDLHDVSADGGDGPLKGERRALADFHHGDDGGDADGDAQAGEDGAHGVAAKRLECSAGCADGGTHSLVAQ